MQVADSFLSRLVGLLHRKPNENADGLLLLGCNSIHTIGMKSALLVIMIDVTGRVRAVATCQPGRFMRCAAAVHTLELFDTAAEFRVGELVTYDIYNRLFTSENEAARNEST